MLAVGLYIIHVKFQKFQNSRFIRKSQKIGLLYVNRRVSENRAFMRKLFFNHKCE